MIRQLAIILLTVFLGLTITNCLAKTGDTCFTKVDTLTNRVITICIKSKGKTPASVSFGDGKLFTSKYRTKTITILQNNQLVYKLYRKTRMNTDILHTLTYKISKWNSDGSKEILIITRNGKNYKYTVYDIHGKKIKTENILSSEINWDNWIVVKE